MHKEVVNISIGLDSTSNAHNNCILFIQVDDHYQITVYIS